MDSAAKAQWIEQADGAIRLDPKPLIKVDVTLGEFMSGCELLGLDPDSVLNGTADVEELEGPSPETRRDFFQIALENPEPFVAAEMDEEKANAVLAMIATYWIASARHS